jgi:HSP20 family protein
MAETKSNPTQEGRQTGQALSRSERESRGLRRWDPNLSPIGSPFEFFDRMTEEMDRAFDRMWTGAGILRRPSMSRFFAQPERGAWAPRIESFQKGDQFVVRAELPGLKKDDVEVELKEGALTIHGERREEHEESREGYMHTEREYGQFYRTIALPEGVIAESAQASFRDGVLEITMQAPPQEAMRGRKLEIKDAQERAQK